MPFRVFTCNEVSFSFRKSFVYVVKDYVIIQIQYEKTFSRIGILESGKNNVSYTRIKKFFLTELVTRLDTTMVVVSWGLHHG